MSKSTPKKSSKTTKKVSKKSIVKKPSAMATAGKVAAAAAPVKVGATTAAASALAPPSPKAPRTGPQESDKTLFDPDYGVIGGLTSTFDERLGKTSRFGTDGGGIDIFEAHKTMAAEKFSVKRDDTGDDDSRPNAWILASETKRLWSVTDPVIDHLKSGLTAKNFSDALVTVYYCVLSKGRTSALANPQNATDWLQIKTFPRFYAVQGEDTTKEELMALNPAFVTITDPVFNQFGIMNRIGHAEGSPPDWAGWGDGSRGNKAGKLDRGKDSTPAASLDKVTLANLSGINSAGQYRMVRTPSFLHPDPAAIWPDPLTYGSGGTSGFHPADVFHKSTRHHFSSRIPYPGNFIINPKGKEVAATLESMLSNMSFKSTYKNIRELKFYWSYSFCSTHGEHQAALMSLVTQLKNLGGLFTCSGGMGRSIRGGVKTVTKGRHAGRQLFGGRSHHSIGRAFDLGTRSGFQNPDIDLFVCVPYMAGTKTNWDPIALGLSSRAKTPAGKSLATKDRLGHHPHPDPRQRCIGPSYYISLPEVRRKTKNQLFLPDGSGTRSQKFAVYARVSKGGSIMTLPAIYHYKGANYWKLTKGRFVNFSEMAAKQGYVPIPAQGPYINGRNYMLSEWWHFQRVTGLIKGKEGTPYLEELLKFRTPESIVRETGHQESIPFYANCRYKGTRVGGDVSPDSAWSWH